MKKLLCLLFFLIFSLWSFAQQIKLDKQKGFNYKRFVLLDSIGVPEPDFSQLDIVLRIHYVTYAYGDGEKNYKIIQLCQDKSGKWEGVSYFFYLYNLEAYDFKNVAIEPIVFKSSWSSSWQEIIKKNYLNMPKQSEYKLAYKRPDAGGVIVIADGESYIIEVLTKKRKRRFSCSNPNSEYGARKSEGYIYPQYLEFQAFITLLRSEFDF